MQLVILVPYLIKASHFAQRGKDIGLKVLEIFVRSAPPAVPAVMLLCGFNSLIRLRKKGINLMFREVLNLAAGVDFVCFDKTGTLTDSVVSICGEIGSTSSSYSGMADRSKQVNHISGISQKSSVVTA